MEDYGNHVEILGVKFPAVNIQIWPESPELHHTIGFDAGTDDPPLLLTYGIYFEMMFENGSTLTIHQEAADCANGICETHCQTQLTNPEEFLNHFVISAYSKDQTQEPYFTSHCLDESDLVSNLQILIKGLAGARRDQAA